MSRVALPPTHKDKRTEPKISLDQELRIGDPPPSRAGRKLVWKL